MSFIETLSTGSVNFYENFLGAFTLDTAIKFMVMYVMIIWLAVIIWVIKDITHRTTNLLIQVLSILLVVIFTPVFGLPVYLLIRPRTTLFEQYYEATSLEELEKSPLQDTDHISCGFCGKDIQKDFKFCPHCSHELLDACPSCSTPVQSQWEYCPQCQTPRGESWVKKIDVPEPLPLLDIPQNKVPRKKKNLLPEETPPAQ